MNTTRYEKALIITLLFRFLFGGYIGGMDQYLFHDVDSALTVILTYAITGLLFSLYLCGKRTGLKALIGLEAIFLCINVLYTIMSITQMFDPSLHDPLANVWLTLTQIIYSISTLFFSIKVNREAISP